MSAAPLDRAWLDSHPLPDHPEGTDKNGRGRVIAVGGSQLVPGALRLTGEAVLRAGAGKLRMATIAEATVPLGIAMPEAAVIALPVGKGGEIDAAAADRLLPLVGQCDALIVGPGMSDRDAATALVAALLNKPLQDVSLLLDAAAVACAGNCARLLRRWNGRVVLTPHHGEMARLTGLEEAAIADDPEGSARKAAAHFDAVVALKGAETVVASPDGTTLRYRGGGVGLATGGSGDVLAGIIGGLLSRGAPPLEAAAWGVWLHGEAGGRLIERTGPIGFLARELLPEIPRLMASR
jgi:ADP-dependent NAD(P)H-hydrate dehydratase